MSKSAVEAAKKGQPLFEEMLAGADFTEEMHEVFQLLLDEVAKDISKQNKRLGGNMAVAHAVFSRRQREALRKILGPECVFIVLNMSRDCQKKRVIARYRNIGFEVSMDKLLYMYVVLACQKVSKSDSQSYL